MRTGILVLLLPLIVGGVYKEPADEWLEPGTYSLRIDGRLETELVDKLVNMASHGHIDAIVLDSWGGDGDAGIVLADFVSRWDKKVVILNRCNSACSFAALVALGQHKLWIGPDAYVGVHQVYDNNTGNPDVAWTKRAAKILSRYGAPKAPLDAMVRTPPRIMTVFHESQLLEMGAAALPQQSWWRWLMEKVNE